MERERTRKRGNDPQRVTSMERCEGEGGQEVPRIERKKKVGNIYKEGDRERERKGTTNEEERASEQFRR